MGLSRCTFGKLRELRAAHTADSAADTTRGSLQMIRASASASRRPRQDRKQSLATLNEDKSFRSASFKSQSSSSNQRIGGSLDRTGTPRDPSVQSTGSSSTAPGEYRRIYKPDQGVPGGGRHGGGRESSSQRYEPAAI